MLNYFDKTILEQMYEARAENFEMEVYKNQNEIKEIESKSLEILDELTKIIDENIKSKDTKNVILNKFKEYELQDAKQIPFWSKNYYKLGATDIYKLNTELNHSKKIKTNNTFFDYADDDLNEYIEDYRFKYMKENPDYLKLKAERKKISEKYPNVLKLYEDFEPVMLTKEETKGLIKLIEIEMDIEVLENKMCFELGIREVLNF